MWLMLALYFAYFTNLYWVPVCKARLHSHRHIFSCFEKCSCLLICVGSDFQEVEIELINGQNTAFGLGFKKDNLWNAKLFSFWTQGLPDGVHGNRPCPSVSPLVRPSVFKYLGDPSFNFSETLHEVRGQ